MHVGRRRVAVRMWRTSSNNLAHLCSSATRSEPCMGWLLPRRKTGGCGHRVTRNPSALSTSNAPQIGAQTLVRTTRMSELVWWSLQLTR
jgi:hypothetical protein